MGVHMVLTMTIGELLTIVSVVASTTAIIVGVRWELKLFKREITAFRGDLSTLSGKVEKHEDVLRQLFGQIQRLIGALYGKGADPVKAG